jgi:hypothetical protein
MEMKEICPCPNLQCPNHGVCENCTSRHLKLGLLNFCAFHTILPKLQEAIESSPESPTAKSLTTLIGNQSQAYAKLMEKHGISEENQEQLLKQVAEYSDY